MYLFVYTMNFIPHMKERAFPLWYHKPYFLKPIAASSPFLVRTAAILWGTAAVDK